MHPEEKEFIAYLKSIDSMIEERISKVLEGVKVLHRNAVHISESLDTVHMKVLVNLDKATNNL